VSQHIETTERIITIEDAVELKLQQPHVVQMETRPPNIEGAGHIPQRELVRNALRMRPDRIIVGEVRGPEAFDMLQAMNTGHDGSMTTVHANSPRDALYRIENMVMMANLSLPLKAIRMQVASALNLIVQVERMRDGIRRVQNVVEIAGMEGEIVTFADLGEFIDYPIKTYSAGMLVRLAFAISTAVGGDLLLIDEVIAAGAALMWRAELQRNYQVLESTYSRTARLIDHTAYAAEEFGIPVHVTENLFQQAIGTLEELQRLGAHGWQAFAAGVPDG